MANAATKAAANSGEKPARKKPVRKGPKLSDYPSRVAYLEAVLEHERAEQAKVDKAKVARLDKRIQSVTTQIDELRTKLDALTYERAELTGHGHKGEPADADMPEAADA